jgi:type IV fimbrial biogenesis protein FimT
MNSESLAHRFAALHAQGLASRASRTRMRGFTMIELAVVMIMVAILTMIAIPSFQYITTANRISSEINSLLGDLQYARIEAVKEGYPVTVCPSSNGTTCTVGNNWAIGWIVFADSNGDGVVGTAPVEAILRVEPAIPNGDTLTSDNTNATKGVTFNRDGFAFNLNGTITYTLHNSTDIKAYTRCLAVNIVGRLMTESAGQKLEGGNTCT